MAKKITKVVKKTSKTKSRAGSSPKKVTSKKKVLVPVQRQKVLRQIEELEEAVDGALATSSMDAAELEGELLVIRSKPYIQDREPMGKHSGHAIVRARAGTGKTFTLIMGVANMFRDEKLQGSYTFRGPRNKILGYAETSVLWGKVERECSRWKNPLSGHWEYPDKPKKVIPSKEQQAVWDFMAKGPKPRTICYVAFNNSIVDEFSEKYDWMVELLNTIGIKLCFSTVHSLGNAACKARYKMRGWKTVNKYRTSDLLSALWQKDLKEVWKEEAENIQAIQELVGLSKQTLLDHPSDDALEAMMLHYGITATDPGKVFKAVQALLPQCKEVPHDGTGRIDFNDMTWLPIVNNLPMVERYDLVIGDEAQDWNRCQQQILLASGERIIVVGDDRQSMYAFAGADSDSIDRMAGLLGGPVEMRLTQTRRCGKAIVALAKQLVPDFECHPDNCAGKVTRVKFEALESMHETLELEPEDNPDGDGPMLESPAHPYSLGESDMVLCRVNAPLVGLAFRMMKVGKRVNIKGRDIGEGLKAFIKKSKCTEVTPFLDWLDKFQQMEAERIQKRRNVDSEALVTLEDKCLCLRTFAEGAITVKDMYKAIDTVFKGKVCPMCKKSYDEKQKLCWDDKSKLVVPEGTLLSSVHRAKGMEAKRVFILRPDLMPHPMAKTPMDKGQEANIMYVAQTRAIEELVFVDGKHQGKGIDNE